MKRREFIAALGGALVPSVHRAVLDRDSAAIDPAEFPQPLRKSGSP